MRCRTTAAARWSRRFALIGRCRTRLRGGNGGQAYAPRLGPSTRGVREIGYSAPDRCHKCDRCGNQTLPALLDNDRMLTARQRSRDDTAVASNWMIRILQQSQAIQGFEAVRAVDRSFRGRHVWPSSTSTHSTLGGSRSMERGWVQRRDFRWSPRTGERFQGTGSVVYDG